jgi:hypothetical protein
MERNRGNKMLTDYIQAAIDSINWTILDNGSFCADIPLLGLHISQPRLEECQKCIRDMLEEHIINSLWQKKALPAIGDIEIKVN